MNDDTMIDRLVRLGVLVESGDRLSLSESLDSAIEECRSSVSTDGGGDVLEEMDTDGDSLRPFLGSDESERRYLPIVCALESVLGQPVTPEWVAALPVIDQLADTPPRSSGAPNVFFPVHGDGLDSLLSFYPQSVVYIWREDCDPCDAMRETLETALSEPPGDVALFAVYGPDYADSLWEAYDAYGAPIVLFVRDGSVEARLAGVHHRSVVENEVEILREDRGPT